MVAEGEADFKTTVPVGKEFSSNNCSLGDPLSAPDRLYEELPEARESTCFVSSSSCVHGLGRGLLLDLHQALGG